MQAFEAFLRDTGKQGRVNLLFESAMYNLLDELDQIVRVMSEAKVAFAMIGGMAVNAHLSPASKTAAPL